MDDLTNKLSELLNKPGSMEKLQSALSSLGLNGNNAESDSGDEENDGDSASDSGANLQELLQTLAPAMGGSSKKEHSGDSGLPDLRMIAKLAPMIANFNRDDENTVLLKALRPYLHGEREKRLDDTIQMMRLMKLLPLLQDKELF